MEIPKKRKQTKNQQKITELLNYSAQIAHEKKQLLIIMQEKILKFRIDIEAYHCQNMQDNKMKQNQQAKTKNNKIAQKHKGNPVIQNGLETEQSYEKLFKVAETLRFEMWNLTSKQKQLMKLRTRLLKERKFLQISSSSLKFTTQKNNNNKRKQLQQCLSQLNQRTSISNKGYLQQKQLLNKKLSQNLGIMKENQTKNAEKQKQVFQIDENICSHEQQIPFLVQKYNTLQAQNSFRVVRLSQLKMRIESLNQQFLGAQVQNTNLNKQSFILEDGHNKKMMKLDTKVKKLQQIKTVLMNLIDRYQRNKQQYEDRSQITRILSKHTAIRTEQVI